MSERRARLALLLALVPLVQPAAAEPVVTLLDLPFTARAMRGPGSEVALAVATSGLLPLARPRGTTGQVADAPIVVVWGDEGGAALVLVDGQVTTTLLGAEAVEGLAAAETPRGAVAGSRRALLGPVSAHLSDPLRASAGEPERAGTLTIRERQPVGMSAEPKPVPIVTTAVAAGPDAAFALRPPRIALMEGRPVVVAVTVPQAGGSALALVGQPVPEAKASTSEAPKGWAVFARSPNQPAGMGGQALKPAAIADFAGSGRPQIASVAAPDGAALLQLWAYEAGGLRLAAEAAGYTDLSPGEAEADLAATLDADADGVPELALPVADRSALAILSLKDGSIRERSRIPLPGPAAFGVAALGQGRQTRLLVGLADGRIALVSPGP